MKSSFQASSFTDTELDLSKLEVKKEFNSMGYSRVSIQSSNSNGLSHYVTLEVAVINEGKTYSGMYVEDNKAMITVRISDHSSGLENNCGGVSGSRMTMTAFKRLIATGAIATNN